MSNRGLSVLAVVSLIVAGFTLFDPWAQQPPTIGQRVISLAVATQLQGVHVSLEAEELGIARTGAGEEWRLLSGGATHPAAVQRLLSSLQLLRIDRRSKVQRGTISLRIRYQTFAGAITELAIGQKVGRYRWAFADESTRGWLLESYLIDEIVEACRALPSRRVIPWAFTTEPLRLTYLGQELTIHGTELTWTQPELPVVRFQADGQKLALWLRDFNRTEFSSQSENTCGFATYPIFLAQGQQRTELDVCGVGLDGVGLDSGSRFGSVTVAQWQRIVGVLEAPLTLARGSILPNLKDVDEFTVSCGEQTVVVNAGTADSSRLAHWWQDIADAVSAVVKQQQPMTAQCTIAVSAWRVEFGQNDGQWRAQVSGEDVQYQLDSNIASLLRVDDGAFLSLDLVAEEPLFARKIRINTQGEEEWSIDRGLSLGTWTQRGKPATDRNAQIAKTVSGTLAQLSGLSYLPKEVRSPKVVQTILIDFESAFTGDRRRYKIELSESDETDCVLRVNGGRWVTAVRDVCTSLTWQNSD